MCFTALNTWRMGSHAYILQIMTYKWMETHQISFPDMTINKR